jgi:hypothetical protein
MMMDLLGLLHLTMKFLHLHQMMMMERLHH